MKAAFLALAVMLAGPARADCTVQFNAFAAIFLGDPSTFSPPPLIEEAGGRCYLNLDEPDAPFALDWSVQGDRDLLIDIGGGTLPTSPEQVFGRAMAYHDAQAGTLRVEMATLHLPGGGFVDVRGVLSGLDLSSTAAAQVTLSGAVLESGQLTADLAEPMADLAEGAPPLAEGLTDAEGRAAWESFLAAGGRGRLTVTVIEAPRLPLLPMWRALVFGEATPSGLSLMRNPLAWRLDIDWTPAGAN